MFRRTLCALSLLPALAHANTPEDVFGASGRTISMGGAGTALPGDYSGAHYNPANLAYCSSDQADLDVSYISHHLSFTDENVAADQPLVPKRVRNQTRVMIGNCISLPFDLSLGLMLGFGTPGAVSLDQQTANQQPHYVMYGEANEQVVFATGIGWKATPTFSIGAGFAALIKTNLPLTADFPILEPDPMDPTGYKPVSFQLGVGMGAYLAPRVGFLWTPSSRFRFGGAYRGALYHDLDVDAKIDAKLIIDVPVPVHVDSLGWFSPRQFSLGASGEPTPDLTLTADATYYRWGELADKGSSYPFLNMYSLDPQGASGALVFPRPIHSGWKNNFSFRGGGELRVRDGQMAIRAGIGYRTRAVDNPVNSNVNLLDTPVVTLATGVGWYAGQRAAAPAAPRPPKPTTHHHWWRYDLPHVTFRGDAFVRVDHLIEQQVDHMAASLMDVIPEKHFKFGGDVLQVGVMATLGW